MAVSNYIFNTTFRRTTLRTVTHGGGSKPAPLQRDTTDLGSISSERAAARIGRPVARIFNLIP